MENIYVDGVPLSAILRSARAGNLDAQHILGHSYYFGHGVPVDYDEAFKWLKMASDRGSDGETYACLGLCYHYGRGTEKDYEKAIKWFRRAAVRGVGQAQGFCGYMYWNGEGVASDRVEAYAWMLVASSEGEMVAINELPRMREMMTSEQVTRAESRAKEMKEFVEQVRYMHNVI